MPEIIEMLHSVRPDLDFAKEKSLIDDGLLDSVDVMGIVLKLKERFGLEVSLGDLDPDDFNSAETIMRFVERKTHVKD